MSLLWLSDYVSVKTTHSWFNRVFYAPPALFSFPPETLMWIMMGQLTTRSAGLSLLLVSRNMLDSTPKVWRSTKVWGLRCALSGTASYHASSTSPVNTRYCLYFRDNCVLHVLLGTEFLPLAQETSENSQACCRPASQSQSLCVCSSSSPSFTW